VGVSRDCPKFSGTPYYLGNGKSYRFQKIFKFGQYIQRVHPNKSPLKFQRKGSVGVSRDCPIFWEPPIMISGIGEATDLKFSQYIPRVRRNKSP